MLFYSEKPGVLTEFKLKISLSMEIDTCPDYQSASGSKPCNFFAAVWKLLYLK